MYLRETSRKNKDGSRVSYLQLAHNVWDAEAGHARAQILYNFGRADQVDREGLERLVRSISRFLRPEARLEIEMRLQGEGDVRLEKPRSLGGAWVLDQLWRRLGIQTVLEKTPPGAGVPDSRRTAPLRACGQPGPRSPFEARR